MKPGALVVGAAKAQLLEVVDALDPAQPLRAACTAGSSSPIKTAMIAMTTSNSIRVNPRDEAVVRSIGS